MSNTTTRPPGSQNQIKQPETKPTPPPEYLAPHQADYKDAAWKKWDLYKLGNIVAFFAERSTHRDNPEKRAKDLTDARNYWKMAGEHLDNLELEHLKTMERDKPPTTPGTDPQPTCQAG